MLLQMYCLENRFHVESCLQPGQYIMKIILLLQVLAIWMETWQKKSTRKGFMLDTGILAALV